MFSAFYSFVFILISSAEISTTNKQKKKKKKKRRNTTCFSYALSLKSLQAQRFKFVSATSLISELVSDFSGNLGQTISGSTLPCTQTDDATSIFTAHDLYRQNRTCESGLKVEVHHEVSWQYVFVHTD